MIEGKRVYSRTVYDVEAAARIAQAMRQKRHGAVERAKTLGDAMDAVLEETGNAQTRSHYAQKFEGVLKHLPRSSVLAGINKDHIRAMRDAMATSVSAATVNRHLSALRRVFSLGVEREWCQVNPASTKATPFLKERRTEMDWFEEGEFRVLLGRVYESVDQFSAATRHGDWMAIMAMTGLRRSEFARSMVRDWNLRTRNVFVEGKTENRTIPFSPDLVPSIERVMEASEGGSLGTPKPNTLSGTFRVWANRLGERRLHPHALRHTFATSLVRQGHDVETVRHLMGHSSIEQTMRYFHVCGVAARTAVEGLRLLPQARESTGDAPQ